MSTASEQTADTGELDDTTVEIERTAAPALDAHPAAARCTNGGTPLTGPYCSLGMLMLVLIVTYSFLAL